MYLISDTGSDTFVVAVAIGTLISLLSAVCLGMTVCFLRRRCTESKQFEEEKKSSIPTISATPIATSPATPVLYPVHSYAYPA